MSLSTFFIKSSMGYIRSCFVLFVIFSSFLITVSADSGSLTASTNYFSGNYTTNGFLGVDDLPINFNKLYIDFADYNTISSYVIFVENQITFSNESASTPFTITSGGSGTGIASYDKSHNKIYWFFNDAHVTGSPLVLSYTDNIFSGVAGIGGNFRGSPNPLVFDHPIALACEGGNGIYCVGVLGGAPMVNGFIQQAYVSQSVTNNYSVSTTQAGSNLVYTLDVDKTPAGAIQTKWYLYNLTGINYFVDAMNTVSFSNSQILNNGLSVNMTTGTGSHATINLLTASGTSGIPLPPVVGTGGSPSGQIYFDYSTAALTYPYGINVSLADANFTTFPFTNVPINYYRIRIYDNINNEITGSPVDISTQQYSTGRLWQFLALGLYRANLTTCSKVSCFSETVIDTATISIGQQQYNYSVIANANSYSTGDVVRFTVINPSPSITYFNMNLLRGGSYAIIDQPVQANSTAYINVSVTGDMLYGTWQGDLNTNTGGSGMVAQTTFTIGNPVPGSKVSVRWDSNYVLGETNNLFYSTNANTSTVTVRKTLPGTNASILSDTFTANPTDSQPKPYLMDVVGQWSARIVDNGNASNFSYANITVSGGAGCNKNLPDYVCWDKASYVKGDPYILNYKITNIPNLLLGTRVNEIRLLVYDPDGVLMANKTLISVSDLYVELPFAGTGSQAFKSNAKSGQYHAVIMSGGRIGNSYTDGTVIADSYAIVVDSSSAAGGGGTNTTSVPGTPRAIIDGWTALFGWGVNDVSRFFFALLFVTAGMFAGFMMAGKNLYGGVFGAFLPWAFFALPSVNYIPSWVTIFIAIIVALKVGWFK